MVVDIVDLYLNKNMTLREIEGVSGIDRRGGGNELDNLTIACRRCNARKGTKTNTEFKKEAISW